MKTAKTDLPSGNLIRDLEKGRSVLVRRGSACEIRAKDDEQREIEFVASTEGIKRDGHEVMARGFNFDSFDKNRAFLWAHQQGDGDSAPPPPIGSVSERWIEENDDGTARLMIKVRFARHEFAQTIYDLYRDGHMTSVSIGWLPIKTEPIVTKGSQSGVRFLESELLEVSAVPIPADPDAVMSKAQRGLISPDLLDAFARGVRNDSSEAYMLDARDPIIDTEEATIERADEAEERVCENCDDPECEGCDEERDEERGEISAESSEVADAKERAEDEEAKGEAGDISEAEQASGENDADGGRDVTSEEVKPLVAVGLELAESIEALSIAVGGDDRDATNEALGALVDVTVKLNDLVGDLIGVDDEDEEPAAEDDERTAASILKSLLDDAEGRIGTPIAKKRHDTLNKAKDALREAVDLIDAVMSDSRYNEDADEDSEERSAESKDIDALARMLGVADDNDDGQIAELAALLDD